MGMIGEKKRDDVEVEGARTMAFATRSLKAIGDSKRLADEETLCFSLELHR